VATTITTTAAEISDGSCAGIIITSKAFRFNRNTFSRPLASL